MRTFAIEGGLYLLLLFTPLAFGGVEMWAHGVIQILTGIIFVVWAWGRIRRPTRSERRHTGFWVAIGLFVLLVVFQMVPLPPGAVRELSPATYRLYAQTLPGYAEGHDFDPNALDSWLLQQADGRIPSVLESGEAEGTPAPPPAGDFHVRTSSWKTLSIYPFMTRQKVTILCCYLALLAVVLSHFRTRGRLSRLLNVAVLCGFLVSFLGIVEKLSGNQALLWLRAGDYTNSFGPFVNRNNYAAYAGLVLPLAVCLALEAFRQVRTGIREALPRLLLSGFASVVIGGGIFYSLSRGGMIAAGLSTLLVALFLFYYGRHGMELVLLGVLLASAAGFLIWLGPEQVVERAGTLSEAQGTPSFAMRAEAWKHAMSLVADNPVVGTGLGTFAFAFLRYSPPNPGWWAAAHDEYIELICDTGLAGALIFIVGLYFFVRRVPRPSLFKQGAGRYAYVGLVAGIAAILLHSTVSSNLQIPSDGMLLVVLSGALLNMEFFTTTRRRRRRLESAGGWRAEEAGAP